MVEKIESKGVEELSKNVNNPDDAVKLVKKIEKIIKNKSIFTLAYHQGIIFRKFKTNNSFTSAVMNSKLVRQL